MQARVIEPGGGSVARHDGWEAVIKLDSETTGGNFTLLETRHDPGTGAGPHVHSRESETFLVLEGTFRFRVADQGVEVGPGGIVFGPPGVIHGFDVGADGGRLLHLFVPGGMESFFRRQRDATAEGGERLRREFGVESA